MSCVADTWEFYPGQTQKLEIQLKKRTGDCVEIYPLEATDKITVILPTQTGTLDLDNFTPTAPPVVIDSEPYGKISIELSDAETNQLVSGSITVKIEKLDGTIKYALALNIISKINPADC
jgi:hypothetical protein